jgi:hypothetical protein
VLLVGAAAGSAAYAGAVTLLAHWPSVVRARGTGGAARPALVAAVAVPAAVAAVGLWWTSRGRGGRLGRRVGVALLCVAFGSAWLAWGLVEQHLLRTFDVAPGSAAAGGWDALFHGVGVLVAGAGTSILSAGGNRRPVT